MKKVGVIAVVLLTLATAAGAGAVATQRFQASSGDIVLVRGTKTLCAVVGKRGAKSFITCYKAAKNGGPKVKSYGVAITDTGVVVARYLTQTRTKTVYQKRH